MAKKAVIVGINYVGTGNDLQGCINDATMMQALLKNHYSFVDSEIKMVLEKAATTAGIKAALQWLCVGAQPGDTLFFHYSGHGSQMPSKGDDVEVDGVDEIICPIDLDWNTKVITDDYLKWAFNQVPNGANVTVVLDCCNSGTALDQINQYQPVTERETMSKMGLLDDGSRYLPPPADVQTILEGRKQHRRIMRRTRSAGTRDVDQSVMLITGCRSEQTSADAYIGGKYQGAATYALNSCLSNSNHSLNYRDLIDCMNGFMVRNGFTQRPELDGAASLHAKTFLGKLDVAPSQPVVAVSPPTTSNAEKKNYLPFIIAGGAVAAFIVATLVLN